MKKLGLSVITIMAVSFLISCGRGGNSGPTINIYKFTFDCLNCKVLDVEGKEFTTVDVPIISGSDVLYAKFYLKGIAGYHNPLKSSISVKKSDKTVSFEYNPFTGEIIFPIVGNLTITAQGINKTLDECTWSEINEISTTRRAEEFFKIGDTKNIQLKHQDLNNDGAIDDGELYQTVRIIGFNEDYTELPIDGEDPDPSKAIGITFEFANLISDENGYSIATQWNDTDDIDDLETGYVGSANHNYLDSSIRKALTNEGKGHILWAQKGAAEWSNKAGESYTDKSVLDMLPDELTKDGILKAPCKYVNIWNNDKMPEAGWEEQIINDKLFLLSPAEMGGIDHEYEEPSTTAYSYYKDADNAKRIKKQIKNDDICASYSQIPVGMGQTYTSTVYNYAGYNQNTEASGGGVSWLRSPRDYDSSYAWYINHDGDLSDYYGVFYSALAIVPAFCI